MGFLTWVVPFRRALRHFEESKYKSSLGLHANVFICKEDADRRIWKPNLSDVFSSKSFYKELEEILAIRLISSPICTGLAPPRVEASAGSLCQARSLQLMF